MKNSSLGSLIAASALAVAPSAAWAQDSSTAVTPEPAPILTTPAADAPQVSDPVVSTPTTSQRRQRRSSVEVSSAAPDGTTKDPVPTAQATDPSLAAPTDLQVQAVPNFFIEDFDIPPFLIPIYQAAGSEYGIRWEVLASINRVETAFGTNLNVSSAGALGWMQFMPSTWEQYGVDANGDGTKDPFNPADAIFAAARYLKAAGGDTDLRKAVFAYNHADWYVDQVMDGANKIAAIPEPIISSLSALTQGLFPVDAADSKVDYRGKIADKASDETVAPGDEASTSVEGEASENSIEISAPAGSKVVAVQDGIVEKVGRSERLGTYVRLRDAYGNRYTYAHLGAVQDKVPVPKPSRTDDKTTSDDEGTTPADDVQGTTPDAVASTTPDTAAPEATTEPTTPAAEDHVVATKPVDAAQSRERVAAADQDEAIASPNPAYTPRKIRVHARTPISAEAKPAASNARSSRLFAHPTLPDAYASGGAEQINPQVPVEGTPADSLAEYFSVDYGLKPSDVTLKTLKEGTQVIAGTVLGRLEGSTDELDATSKLTFEIRPAGKKAPRIDPKPILDGWRLMDRTAFYKAQAKEAVKAGKEGDELTAGQVLLLSKSELQHRVLTDKRISIYECGRRDIRAGIIDRRILALLEYLAVKGATPTVTALECGHSLYTTSGNISEHSTGSAVDIGSVYDTVITPATQGEGSITDRAVREILQLQGAMKPHQIITLMKYDGADNTLSMSNHDDHIHVGYRPLTDADGKQLELLLKPGQWNDLLSQVGSLKTPEVAASPSAYAISVEKPSKK